MKTTVLALVASLAAPLAASLALTAPALAHSKGEKTIPADGTTVEVVEEVVLRFDKPMRVTQVALSGEAGDIDLTSEMGTDAVTEYVATPEDAVAPGAYELEWRGLSADGHPMQGGFTFTVAE